jgi:hypothetical protein
MATDKLDSLQAEIKLMKGELKQSLASVRDYLLNMELPSSEISNILSALGDEGEKVTMKGSLDTPKDDKASKEPEDVLTETEEVEDEAAPPGDDLLDLENAEEEEDEEETAPEDNAGEEDGDLDIQGGPVAAEDELGADEDEDENLSQEDNISTPEDELNTPNFDAAPPEFDDEPEQQEPEMFNDEEPMQEEPPMQYENATDDTTLSVPKVNMLANLINWVANANKEIGRDSLATFLEVYGISGHLSPELKEVILHLSEITGEETNVTSSTEIWSRAMLLLHGILTGGDAPLHPVIPAWESENKQAIDEEIIEVDKPKNKSVKLKLVLPDEQGEEREFCINLSPEADSDKP